MKLHQSAFAATTASLLLATLTSGSAFAEIIPATDVTVATQDTENPSVNLQNVLENMNTTNQHFQEALEDHSEILLEHNQHLENLNSFIEHSNNVNKFIHDTFTDHNETLADHAQHITNNTQALTNHSQQLEYLNNFVSYANETNTKVKEILNNHADRIEDLIARKAEKTDVNHNKARIQGLEDRANRLEKRVRKGFATQAALTGLFQPYSVGKANISAAVGGYQSNTAVAVGTGYRFNEHVATKAGVAFTTGNNGAVSYNVGVNYEW